VPFVLLRTAEVGRRLEEIRLYDPAEKVGTIWLLGDGGFEHP